MTLDEFKKIKMQAMKDRDTVKVTALNSVISKLMLLKVECNANGTELTENDVTNCLKKVEKELIEEKECYEKGGREDSAKELQKQIDVICEYLPKMMSAEEIKAIIMGLEDKTVPSVMRYFKTTYAGKVDLKTVSEVLKTI